MPKAPLVIEGLCSEENGPAPRQPPPCRPKLLPSLMMSGGLREMLSVQTGSQANTFYSPLSPPEMLTALPVSHIPGLWTAQGKNLPPSFEI